MDSKDPNVPNEKIYSSTEVAEALSVSTRTLLRWIHSKKIVGFFRIGNAWRIRESDLDAFIGKKIHEATTYVKSWIS